MRQPGLPRAAFALLWLSLAAFARGAEQPGLRASRETRLLQAARPDDPNFFAEDSHRMAELPGYDLAAYKRVEQPPPSAQANAICMPHCRWKCGPSPTCNSVCNPVCAPPKCQTLCERREELCETRCGPPQCAVVCPSASECRKPPCAKCMTVCSPPLCTTECGETCTNVCAKPSCTWSCHQGSCPKPKCEMDCQETKPCSTGWPQQTNATLPAPPGEIATVWGEASMDPAVLLKPVVPPPKWMTHKAAPPPTMPVAAPAPSGPPASAMKKTPMAMPSRPFDSPVRALKLRWAAEDMKKRASLGS
jgi:hypothetical protein